MSYRTKSYLTAVATLVLLLTIGRGSKAQSIFVQPSEEFITSGIGYEFDLEIRVDDQFPSLKSFVFHLNFDASKLDTVSTAEGPLFPSSGQGTVFNVYISGGNSLQIEGLILGAGVDVSGPGLLATIRLVTLDTGIVDMSPTFQRLRDVAGNLLSATPQGATVYIDVPPDPFELIYPIEDEIVRSLPGENITLEWTPSATYYPGESVEYRVEYGTSPTFDAGSTTTVTGVMSTSYPLPVNNISTQLNYWRVTAIGDTYDFERPSTPESESFIFLYTWAPPEPFDLISPDDGVQIRLNTVSEVTFDWEDAASVITGDDVDYAFYIGPDPNPPTGALLTQPTLESEVTFDKSGLPTGLLYWRVEAINMISQRTLSTSVFQIDLYAGCCEDRVGDANGLGGDEPTIGDISSMIDALFITNNDGPLPCLSEADMNQSGGPDPQFSDISIGDISILIDYLFITGPSLGLPDCL